MYVVLYMEESEILMLYKTLEDPKLVFGCFSNSKQHTMQLSPFAKQVLCGSCIKCKALYETNFLTRSSPSTTMAMTQRGSMFTCLTSTTRFDQPDSILVYFIKRSWKPSVSAIIQICVVSDPAYMQQLQKAVRIPERKDSCC